jgi:demethylmenaquinone methyltransferase/2-methoxy-6-polyprenyl-1,4-benzoquinol methylase
VFDVACGAGAILPELARRVGIAGRVIGIEQSPEMAALARHSANGAENIDILGESAEEFRAPYEADAVILCYTHDVLQSPAALSNLFRQVKPGARVAVAGLCLAPWWGMVGNAWVLWGARHYLTTWRGLRGPWAPLVQHCPNLRVVSRHYWSTGYIATGRAQ